MSPQVNSHKHEEQEDPDRQKSFWGVRCESGNIYCRVLSSRCNITMAALEPNTSKAENSWLSLMMEHKGSQYLLCSLKHDAVMQVPLNLIFEKGVKIKFSVRGQGTVHLTGFQEGSSADTEVNETDQKEEKEEACSTVGKTIKNGQIFCEICGTFIKSEPFWRKHIQKKNHIKNLKLGKVDKSSCSPKNTKNNPSTSNSMSPDDEDSSEVEEIPPNMPSGSSGKADSGVPLQTLLSKGLRKQLSQIDDDEDDEEDQDFNALDEEESEEDDDDEDSDDDMEEEDDDDDDSDESGDMVNKALEAQKRKREAEALNSSKRAKKNNSMSEASTSNASLIPIEIFVKDDEEDDESSSEEESEDSSENESSVYKKSPLIKNAQTLNKKKKSSDGVQQIESNSKPNSGKADDSLQVTELRVGYGPPAKAGKMVQVFYVGKNQDGKTFDQTEAGKPFSFKLGAGQVLKGWDMGVEGMKVGGKRRIKIPPHLGYGNKETDGIPANSTLTYIVELKSIS